MDRVRLEMAAQAVAWLDQPRGTDTPDAQSQADRLRDQMTNICNEAMPRAKPTARKTVYWWTPDLEAKRRECIRAEHRLHRRRRYGGIEGEEEERLKTARKTAVKALRTAIAEAKNRAWDEPNSGSGSMGETIPHSSGEAESQGPPSHGVDGAAPTGGGFEYPLPA